ncbi:MAG: hypothetical protein HY077_05355 [Elusimicrobia bacterium]|nr:hypothetical protein [Elusimicrobiota bacterium]
MKIFLLVLFVALLGCMCYFHNKQVYDASKSQPVVYTKALQGDVRKAAETAKKAQDAMSRVNQETQKAVQPEEQQQ